MNCLDNRVITQGLRQLALHPSPLATRCVHGPHPLLRSPSPTCKTPYYVARSGTFGSSVLCTRSFLFLFIVILILFSPLILVRVRAYHVQVLLIGILIYPFSLLVSVYTCHDLIHCYFNIPFSPLLLVHMSYLFFKKYSFLLILLKGWLLPATPRSSPCAMILKQSCKPATREGTVGRHRHARRKGSGLPNHRWCVFFPPISCLRTKKKT